MALKLQILFLVCFFAIVLVPMGVVFASPTNGTISGYAWSSQIGWINFGVSGFTAAITDAALSGYAWNENTGRINLNPTQSGVTNNNEGTLSGHAWNEGTGWINFSGVTVNSAGAFSGTATGDNSVSINFSCTNCNVTTDWRPASSRTVASGARSSRPDQEGDARDTQPPFITITKFKSAYLEGEAVVIGGNTEQNAVVTISWANQSGLIQADAMGNWSANLGKLLPGNYAVLAYARDASGNKSNTAFVNFLVNAKAPPPIILPPVIEKLIEKVKPILPGIKKIEMPKTIVAVPKMTPRAFIGDFYYIPEPPLETFVLAPLPLQIKLLAQKFPEVEKTFNEVGIKDFTDIQKLRNVSLKLPNFTESVLPASEIQARRLVLSKGISVTDLSLGQKQKIPSEIVFAKTSGGLIDFNAVLSLNATGQTEQKINTVVGKDLELVVRVEQRAKRVVGYVVLKSRKYNKTSLVNPLERMAVSLLSSLARIKEVITEKSLVLEKFEYQSKGNDVYSATIKAPLVYGEYEVITVVEYENPSLPDKEIRLIAVVDPEGYIYEKNGLLETRVSGAVVAIYWLNPQFKKYELWPAEDFQQENPQTTDVRGTYSFLVPNGYYYITVDAPGYKPYEGKAFEVREGSGVHINIELKSKYGWLRFIDWKTALLALVILLLLYNFYKDKIREKNYHS